MALDNAALSGAVDDSFANKPGQTGLEQLSARLAVENQSGRRFEMPVQTSLVSLEFTTITISAQADSYEPCFELPYSTKPTKAVVVHEGNLDDGSQRLAGGGEVKKHGSRIELSFHGNDKIAFDTNTGNVKINSDEKFQKEVQYKGTAWQKTVLTSNNDTRVTFSSNNLNSVEQDGIKEVFPQSGGVEAVSEPRQPDSDELSRALQRQGRGDLVSFLRELDKSQAAAQKAVDRNQADKTNIASLSKTMKDRAFLLELAASILPSQKSFLNAAAENQFRSALSKMREQFGAGSPESGDFANALGFYLKEHGDFDHQEEIDRLVFEHRRGGLMKDVLETIDKSGPHVTSQSMEPERAVGLRKSLITMHALSGDDGLKGFVDDVNRRLSYRDLIAPADQPGRFRHGAIILTPDGATRYGGSFELVPKQK